LEGRTEADAGRLEVGSFSFRRNSLMESGAWAAIIGPNQTLFYEVELVAVK